CYRDWSSDVCSSDLGHRTADRDTDIGHGWPPVRPRSPEQYRKATRGRMECRLPSHNISRSAELTDVSRAETVLELGYQIIARGEIGRASCRERGGSE